MAIDFKYTEFPRRLKSERKRLRLTQAQLGELGGVSLTSQHSYESGAHRPDSRYLARVADAGVDVLYVLLGEKVAQKDIAAMDWSVAFEIAQLIVRWADRQTPPPPAEMQSHFLKFFYEHFRSSDHFDIDQYEATLRHVG